MILKIRLKCILKIKYRPFLKTIFGGERGGGKFYAPFYRLFYCAYLCYFYAFLKAYFRRKNALVHYAQGQIFVLFICVYNEPLKQIEYELSVFFKAYIVVWFFLFKFPISDTIINNNCTQRNRNP